ncbi:hypothetical protein [Streptomyces sp. NPDC059010]|uniref:hypothetical protein n=1 Tax=Streptomyces sp. NPDC059010 TaxID=3346695 RepID=UPI0036939BFE
MSDNITPPVVRDRDPGGTMGNDARAQWANVAVAGIAVTVSIASLCVACQAKDDTDVMRAKDTREAQIKGVNYSYENSEKGIYVTNQSDAPIRDVVVRLAYSQNQYRYVVLRSLEACMRWELTDANLKAAKPKLPHLPGGGTEFISGSNSASVEISLTDAKEEVWTVWKRGYRQNGYWKTDYKTDHQSGSFLQNRTKLNSTSYRRLDGCTV